MKKKSMFFSLITILMVLLIILSYKISTEKSAEESKLASTQIRIKMLNTFINNLEDVYFEDMLNVASKTALQTLSNYTANNNQLTNVNEVNKKPGDFETVMLFGYLEDNAGGVNCDESLCGDYGKKLSDAQFIRYKNYQYRDIDKDLKTPLMQFYSFFDLLNKTENVLENLGIRTDSFSISLTDLEQETNWNVIFTATIDYHFVDKYKIAAWRGRTEKLINITIYGFEDPLSGKTIKKNWKEDIGPPASCEGSQCQYDYICFIDKIKTDTD